MGYLADEIQDIASEFKIFVTTVDEKYSLEIKKKLAKSFSLDKETPKILSWQNLENTESCYDPNGWKLLENYVGDEEVLLFVNPEEEQEMWRFRNGEDLGILLAESIGFPFCITSDKLNYIICFEDHNCLLGVGDAKQWVKELRENKIANREV